MKMELWLRAVKFILKLLQLGISILILLFFIAFGTQFLSQPNRYPILTKINYYSAYIRTPTTQIIDQTIPHSYNNIELNSLIAAIIFIFLNHFISMGEEKIEGQLNKKRSNKLKHWREKIKDTLPANQLKEFDKRLEKLNAGNKTDRKQLISEFATLKKKLDSMAQYMAFLSADVVDSTGMKRDEDPYIAAHDFDEYNNLLIGCLKENHVLKYALTPDGMMSCFRTTDDAVNAARMLISRLKTFNHTKKQIKRDFHVRCGINGGLVYIDEEIPLEQISDRVIDIAGHMQKYAKPDCINIAASVIEPLKTRAGFNETLNIIDEQKVYEWSSDELHHKPSPQPPSGDGT